MTSNGEVWEGMALFVFLTAPSLPRSLVSALYVFQLKDGRRTLYAISIIQVSPSKNECTAGENVRVHGNL